MKSLRRFKILSILLFVFLIPISLSPAEILSEQELVPASSWVYDALYRLNMEQATETIVETAPLSVQELRFHFSMIDYDSLSASGKNLYDKIDEFLNAKGFAFKLGAVNLGFNLINNTEFLFKTNDDIDWTFATNYAGNKDYFGNERSFGAASS